MNKHYDDLQTGDLILLYGGGWTSTFITWATGGTYSHIAMVLKDPLYIDIKLEGLYIIEANYPSENLNLLRGFLFSQKKNELEEHPLSSDVMSKTVSNGVQIIPFENIFERNQHIYYRKLNCKRDANFRGKIKMLHDKVHHEPYNLDIRDWLAAEINIIIERITGGSVKEAEQLEITSTALNKSVSEGFTFNNPFISRDRTDSYWCSALIGYFYVNLGLLDEKIKWTLLTPENFSSGKEELKFINCTLDDDKILTKKC